MKVYIVCEEYTGTFDGLFMDREKAFDRAKKIGGYIVQYEIEDGKVVDMEELD